VSSLPYHKNNHFLFGSLGINVYVWGMKIDVYFELREKFIEQYNSFINNDFGYVYLKDFKISNFKEFIFIFSNDFQCSFTNTVSSISRTKFMVKRGQFADKIRIESSKSMIEMFPKQIDNINKYYNKLIQQQ
jgi:hypothetical protein